MWPSEAKFLIPGINDTWNDFQKLCKGKLTTTADWKLAKKKLRTEFDSHLANGGVAEAIPDDWRRYHSNYWRVMILKI
jgi:hypothetical protein